MTVRSSLYGNKPAQRCPVRQRPPACRHHRRRRYCRHCHPAPRPAGERRCPVRRAYTTSPLCSPARMALLSGAIPTTMGWWPITSSVPVRTGCTIPAESRISPGTLAPWATSAPTPASGTWAVAQRGPGFDAVLGAGSDYDVDTPAQNDILRLTDRLGIAIGGKQSGYDVDRARHDRATDVGPQLLSLAHHPSHLFMDRATEWVRQRATEPEPFLLVYSCREPHPPFGAPDPFHGRCRPEDMPLSPTAPATRPAQRGQPSAAIRFCGATSRR